jgi:hypothetical protein
VALGEVSVFHDRAIEAAKEPLEKIFLKVNFLLRWAAFASFNLWSAAILLVVFWDRWTCH